MPRSSWRHAGRIMVALSAVALTRCSDSSGSGPTITDIIAQMTVNGLTSAVVQDTLPIGAQGGSGLLVTGGTTLINGGGAQYTLTTQAPFRQIGIGALGVQGYHYVLLPAGVDSVDVVLTIGGALPASQFELAFVVADDTALVGGGIMTVFPVQVGSGDIQVSVSWDVNSDVDLHLVVPGGEEIYYGDVTSSSGGQLDLDSNGGCAADDIRNENITWPQSTPANGTYTVRVDYWDACGEALTKYLVTVKVKNKAVQTFSGTFTGGGDQGGAGSGTTITTFTFP